jgi:murein L,D-transpeptidase YafK
MKVYALKCYLGFALALSLGLSAAHIETSAQEVSKTDQKPDPVEQVPLPGTYPHALLSLTSDSGAFSPYAFLVDKSTRTLTVWRNENDKPKLVGAWSADIGRQGGDKVAEGDLKTPEGIYFFQTMMDGAKLDFNQYGVRIFTMDYPNYFDKLEKKTGSGIWLHAIPDSKSLLRGSRGCVVVRNKVIEELAQYIDLKKTPIVVINQVNYLTEAQWTDQRKVFSQWLEDWRQTWMGKDFDKYMDQYSERFIGNGMTKTQWRAYKKNLGDNYKFIEVNLKDVQIFNHGTKIVLRFLQDYKSDKKKDFGAKILYAMKNGERYEIVGETWMPMRLPKSASAPATANASDVPVIGKPTAVSGSASGTDRQ